MNRSSLLPALLTCLCLFAAPLLAGGDPEKGKTLYAACGTCHGFKGEGQKLLHAPALAGQEDWYLAAQIKNFKDGIRGTAKDDTWGATMIPMMATLGNDQAIADVVAYIQTLKVTTSKPVVKGGNPQKGKTYFATCATCHGPKARGIQSVHSPRLDIQQDWYMLEQLQKFKNGMRGAHPKDFWGSTMVPMANILPDEQAMKDVIAYIKSLQ